MQAGSMFRRRGLSSAMLAGLLALGLLPGATAAAAATVFSTSAPVTILSAEDLNRYGVFYPDMPVGVIAAPGGGYCFFAAGGSFSRIGPGPDVEPTGTYKFVGSLDHITPARIGARGPRPSLMLGRRQASPDGSDFDRDYAGGGPTYPISDRRWGGRTILFQLYHGEYQPDYPRGNVYGGAGAAISEDYGDSFTKLGQILGPHLGRAAYFAGGLRGSIFTDGFLTEGDARGRPVAAAADPELVYYYLIFADRDAPREWPALAIARSRKADLIDAISGHRAPQFKRYYASGAPADGEFFTEPGIGGNFTPIVRQNDYLAQPEAVYDRYLTKFLLVYMVDQRAILLRSGDDLLHWSDPATIVAPAADPRLRVFYPSLVGSDGNPGTFGKKFFLYYLQRIALPGGGFAQPAFLRRTITLAP
jgi:hypothetical protein